MKTSRKKLTIAAPRGFCAGVDRAVRIVEVALEKFGAPVYVRHEIVHNKTVVDGLTAQGRPTNSCKILPSRAATGKGQLMPLLAR